MIQDIMMRITLPISHDSKGPLTIWLTERCTRTQSPFAKERRKPFQVITKNEEGVWEVRWET